MRQRHRGCDQRVTAEAALVSAAVDFDQSLIECGLIVDILAAQAIGDFTVDRGHALLHIEAAEGFAAVALVDRLGAAGRGAGRGDGAAHGATR